MSVSRRLRGPLIEIRKRSICPDESRIDASRVLKKPFLEVTIDTGYLRPPEEIVAILEAGVPPSVVVSPRLGQIAVLQSGPPPALSDVLQPTCHLAGIVINPRTHAQQTYDTIAAVTIQDVWSEQRVEMALPDTGPINWIGFSPDGCALTLACTDPVGVSVYVGDATAGTCRAVGPRLNATTARPCSWLDESHLVLKTLVADQPPVVPPKGPIVAEGGGVPLARGGCRGLLQSDYDEHLFDHYFTSQLAIADLRTGQWSPIGPPAIFDEVRPSPDGKYLLVTRVVRPYSRLVGYDRFPRRTEIWTWEGRLVGVVGENPRGESTPLMGVPVGPRAACWKPTQPATAVWVEAVDGGDTSRPAEERDRVLEWPHPFSCQPAQWCRLAFRFQSVSWTTRGIALVTERDRATQQVRTWCIDGTRRRLAWSVSAEDRYDDPGRPFVQSRAETNLDGYRRGGRTVVQNGSWIYLMGQGASPTGDRPFLDRYDLETGGRERLFQCDDHSYETIIALASEDARWVLTRHETRTTPPNYRLRRCGPVSGIARRVTAYLDPAPALSRVDRRLVSYTRHDGVALHALLYLPTDYREGDRPPLILWAYPQEFRSRHLAGQVAGSPNRYLVHRGTSPLFLLTQGYAVLWNPSMPIVGSEEAANERYVEQLVANAEAAVEAVVGGGWADRGRLGVGGFSYGAFMTANLLAHTRLFRAGMAVSGAYNRTLTPYGFQNERRTFWQARESYARMSPFWYADRIKDPLLLVHGERDPNDGTPAFQSESFFHAIANHGATVRLVILPGEGHGLTARESVYHVLAEMVRWFDVHVKRGVEAQGTACAARHLLR